MTQAEAHDLSRSLRYQAEKLRREAAALDSTASWVEHRAELSPPSRMMT